MDVIENLPDKRKYKLTPEERAARSARMRRWNAKHPSQPGTKRCRYRCSTERRAELADRMRRWNAEHPQQPGVKKRGYRITDERRAELADQMHRWHASKPFREFTASLREFTTSITSITETVRMLHRESCEPIEPNTPAIGLSSESWPLWHRIAGMVFIGAIILGFMWLLRKAFSFGGSPDLEAA